MSNLLESGFFIATLQLIMKMQKLSGKAESSLSWRKADGSHYLILKQRRAAHLEMSVHYHPIMQAGTGELQFLFCI